MSILVPIRSATAPSTNAAQDMLLNNPPPLPDETEPTSGAAPFSSPVEVDEDPLKELRLMGFEESSARGECPTPRTDSCPNALLC